MKSIRQSSIATSAINTLTVSLQTPATIFANSTVSISGLHGSVTPSGQVAVSADGVWEPLAAWDRDLGLHSLLAVRCWLLAVCCSTLAARIHHASGMPHLDSPPSGGLTLLIPNAARPTCAATRGRHRAGRGVRACCDPGELGCRAAFAAADTAGGTRRRWGAGALAACRGDGRARRHQVAVHHSRIHEQDHRAGIGTRLKLMSEGKAFRGVRAERCEGVCHVSCFMHGF